MKKRENKNLKIPGISITYYVITALYMFIGLILLSMNTCFAKLDFFKNSSQVNVITMALTLISIGLAMFGLGYSFCLFCLLGVILGQYLAFLIFKN